MKIWEMCESTLFFERRYFSKRCPPPAAAFPG
jgi:hypothetical protein